MVMGMMRILILFLCVLLIAFIIPVSADYNSSGTVDYFYGYSFPFVVPSELNSAEIAVHKTYFFHRFSDAQVINSITVSDTFISSLSYTKSEITPFTATVGGDYYGSGFVSLVEQLDGDVVWIVDFSTVNTSYASTLTDISHIILSYDTGIWNGVGRKAGTMYYHRYEDTLSSSVPTSMVTAGNTGFMFCYIGSDDPNILLSYNMYYSNSYNYSFNSSSNISSVSIDRSSDESIWSVYDSSDFVYFEDQESFSSTAIDQSFIRQGGVYSNTTFNVAPDPISIYSILDFNGTAVDPDDPPDDGYFEYNITTEFDEYSPGDTVNVTYTTDQKGTIQVVKTISGDIYHSIGFVSGATNATWDFYIAENEPYGFYDIYLLDSSNSILDSVRYSLLPTTSSLDILQSSVDLHETFVVFAQTVNESILSIEDPDGVEVWNESIGALEYDYVYYTPTIKTGVYTAYLYDDVTLNDTVIVYLADAPVIDDPLDPETNGSIVVEDVLDPDESMTEYYNEKFRDFAPTIWGFFMLMCLLFLMSILTSFNSGGKR